MHLVLQEPEIDGVSMLIGTHCLPHVNRTTPGFCTVLSLHSTS